MAVSHGLATIGTKTHHPVDPESPLKLTLVQALLRNERMDLVIQKTVEFGVNRIMPLMTERGVVRLAQLRYKKRREHWQGIIRSACEQSGRTRIPELDGPLTLSRWVDKDTHHRRIFLAPDATMTLQSLKVPRRDLALLIGPEGGWDKAEQQLFESSGYRPIGFGPRILRAETAGMAMVTAAQLLWSDINN